MSRNSIIEQLRASGAVAAHPLNKWVSVVKGKPQKMTLANPLFMDKKVLKNGDKIAIVDTSDYTSAFLCRIANIETSGTSKTQVMDLTVLKTMELEE
jgi:hypothetical protein